MNLKSTRLKDGFTLIEMLVVIAVVGILSATVLTALGPARNKAKDSRIISGLNQFRAIAETLYNGDYSSVDVTHPSFSKIVTDVNSNQGDLQVNLDASNLSYAAYSKLASDSNQYYCVDSDGNAGALSSAPTGPVCQ